MLSIFSRFKNYDSRLKGKNSKAAPGYFPENTISTNFLSENPVETCIYMPVKQIKTPKLSGRAGMLIGRTSKGFKVALYAGLHAGHTKPILSSIPNVKLRPFV